MNDKNTIGDLARLLRLPASTLRYWEQEGLIHFDRDAENNYRSFTMQTIWEIYDIMLYRNLDIPIKKLKHLDSMSKEEMSDLLLAKENELQREAEEILKRIKRIQDKRKQIEIIEQLSKGPGEPVYDRLPAMWETSYLDIELLPEYLDDPYQFIVATDPTDSDRLIYGTTKQMKNDPLLFPEDKKDTLYLKGLLTISNEDESIHNLAELKACAESLGYCTGKIVGRYLLSMFDQYNRDYFECWIELL